MSYGPINRLSKNFFADVQNLFPMKIKLENGQPHPPKGRYLTLEGSTNAKTNPGPHKPSEKGLISNAQEILPFSNTQKQIDATDITEHTEKSVQVKTGSPHEQYLHALPKPSPSKFNCSCNITCTVIPLSPNLLKNSSSTEPSKPHRIPSHQAIQNP